MHEGRTIYYVFARYPQSSGNQYPVHDLVICHGDFLNPMRGNLHLKPTRLVTDGAPSVPSRRQWVGVSGFVTG